MQDALKGRASYNNDLSGLPAGSRAASSDAGSRMGSRPPSTDAYHRGHPASSFNRTNDMFSGQRSRQTSSEVLPAPLTCPMEKAGQCGVAISEICMLPACSVLMLAAGLFEILRRKGLIIFGLLRMLGSGADLAGAAEQADVSGCTARRL